MMYIAVDLNKSLVSALPDSNEKKDALKYLEKCNNNRKQWARSITGKFQSEIT